jgi:hypothetical protein
MSLQAMAISWTISESEQLSNPWQIKHTGWSSSLLLLLLRLLLLLL